MLFDWHLSIYAGGCGGGEKAVSIAFDKSGGICSFVSDSVYNYTRFYENIDK